MQTRSADEAATIIYSCVKCDNKWSIDRWIIIKILFFSSLNSFIIMDNIDK